MKTKLRRAVAAHSMLPAFAVPHSAPTSRTRAGIGGRLRHHLRLASAALLLAAAPFAIEAADLIDGYYSFPAADVGVAYGSIDTPTKASVYDFNLMNPLCGPNQVRSATLDKGAAFGSAQAGKGYGQFAMAGSSDTGLGVATAEAGVWVAIRDPQNRDTVKLNMTIKGFASAPDPSVVATGADYELYVAPALSGTPRAWLLPDGCTVYSAHSITEALLTPLIYYLVGYDEKQLDLEGNVHAQSAVKSYRYGVLTDTTEQSYEPRDVTIEIEPNRNIVVLVAAHSLYGGMAVIDPVITAHPDNPDVEIEITGVPDEDTGRHPFDGFTAEDVAALRINPQPFINLGFLAPSSEPPPPPPPPPSSGDTTPPATTASATPNANIAGWNNTPVTVTLNATDNAGGSGVKEVHYSLDGAAAGSQIVPGASTAVTVSGEGTTTLTYFAVDNAGNQEAAKTLTVKIDRTPPTLTGLPSDCTLWPANNRLVEVASVDAADTLSGLAGPAIVTATSSEPEGSTDRGSVGTGGRGLAPDIVISGGNVQLRAERAGNGTGRVYTITASASDVAGNAAIGTATCLVPHDMGERRTMVTKALPEREIDAADRPRLESE